MIWFLAMLALLVLAGLGVLFLNRYYRKATREGALVRTGLGGQRVVLDGGCLALPFLHKVSEVNMRTSKIEIQRIGPESVITRDRLRVDVGAEFHVRVEATEEGVATAAQALAGKTFRASDLAETLEGKLVNAVLSVAAGYSMESLQDERAKYTDEVSRMLAQDLGQNGLRLESVSLTRLDQTPFHALDENNAFNALGMRRLAEIIATNKKERAVIESDAEVSVHQSQLDATKRRLLLSQEEEEATIAQQREIETARAASQADIAEQQSASERRREAARIAREREVRQAEIARDRELRRQELESELSTETVKVDNAVALAARRIEQAAAESEAHTARAREVDAEEQVQTARERAAAEREKVLALIRAVEQSEVDDTRVRSEAGTLVSMAEAQARATLARANAEKDELLARARGTAALIEAENTQSPELIGLKLARARIEALPGIVEKMMKPAEKIESIRVNHITGIGSGASEGGDRSSGDGGAVNQVVDGMLKLALQLPAVKKLGEEVGLDIGSGMRGLSDSLEAGSGGDKDDGNPSGEGQ
ncbi:MAG: SPFH domain-containing protein [Thiotrichales bacterium]|nr:SPFH domain-containing protein [Thiotrichales bacterium]MCY4286668.1 SPFH domain-containing protein [Thiotrichales bacterium]MCY4350007.1 SPFH domain-containing protein [Thiotrichales bacterium]